MRRHPRGDLSRRLRAFLLAALVALPLLAALPAAACPVCYGEADGEMIQGTKWSVAFLGGLVYLVMGGGVGLVVAQRRRVLRQAAAAEEASGAPTAEPSSTDFSSDCESE